MVYPTSTGNAGGSTAPRVHDLRRSRLVCCRQMWAMNYLVYVMKILDHTNECICRDSSPCKVLSPFHDSIGKCTYARRHLPFTVLEKPSNPDPDQWVNDYGDHKDNNYIIIFKKINLIGPIEWQAINLLEKKRKSRWNFATYLGHCRTCKFNFSLDQAVKSSAS